MGSDEPARSELLDTAFSTLREVPIPSGPSPQVLSTIVEAGGDFGSDLPTITRRSTSVTLERISGIAVGAVLLIGAWLAISYVVTDHHGSAVASTALAEAYKQVRQAKTLTWTDVFYHDVSTKDGKTTWVETIITRCMYKAPGRTRKVMLDDRGQVQEITIEDRARGMRLELLPKEEKATLTHLGKPSERDLRCLTDAFSPVEDALRKQTDDGSEAFLGKKRIDRRTAYGFRLTATVTRTTMDLWVDAETKHLILCQSPGRDVYDPETHPARHNRPGEEWTRTTRARVQRDIVFDRELDDSLFSLDVPHGYSVNTVRVPEPTEKDMIEWLGIQAQCNGNVFLDDEGPIANEPLRRIGSKSDQGKKLSAAERMVLERSRQLDRHHHAVRRFAEVTAGKTWHYQGKGVELGDEDAIVCWYRPKGSKTYRVVHGDLSVKDVPPQELPAMAGPH